VATPLNSPLASRDGRKVATPQNSPLPSRKTVTSPGPVLLAPWNSRLAAIGAAGASVQLPAAVGSAALAPTPAKDEARRTGVADARRLTTPLVPREGHRALSAAPRDASKAASSPTGGTRDLVQRSPPSPRGGRRVLDTTGGGASASGAGAGGGAPRASSQLPGGRDAAPGSPSPQNRRPLDASSRTSSQMLGGKDPRKPVSPTIAQGSRAAASSVVARDGGIRGKTTTSISTGQARRLTGSSCGSASVPQGQVREGSAGAAPRAGAPTAGAAGASRDTSRRATTAAVAGTGQGPRAQPAQQELQAAPAAQAAPPPAQVSPAAPPTPDASLRELEAVRENSQRLERELQSSREQWNTVMRQQERLQEEHDRGAERQLQQLERMAQQQQRLEQELRLLRENAASEAERQQLQRMREELEWLREHLREELGQTESRLRALETVNSSASATHAAVDEALQPSVRELVAVYEQRTSALQTPPLHPRSVAVPSTGRSPQSLVAARVAAFQQ